MTQFDGNTTNISAEDVRAMPNFIMERSSYGMVNYTVTVNLSDGANLDTEVIIYDNYIRVNVLNEPALNKSAQLSFYNLDYVYDPVLYMDDELCPVSICTLIDYDQGTGIAVFNITYFAGSFTFTTANAILDIWDATDAGKPYGDQMIGADQQVTFYANFTNASNGNALSGASSPHTSRPSL